LKLAEGFINLFRLHVKQLYLKKLIFAINKQMGKYFFANHE